MAHYDVFNGDADGICALQQLRLSEPKESQLITGIKRDIALVQQVPAEHCDSATILDISLDKNRDAVIALLEAGAKVSYCDHHFPGDIPQHPNFTALIDTDANVCTSLLVNQRLNDAYLAWAVTAAFGDNLHASALEQGKRLDIGEAEMSSLQTLGTLINYNGYGAKVADLIFAPDDLYRRLSPYADPLDFIADCDAFQTLNAGYESDMAKASNTTAEYTSEHSAVFILPNETWSRRVSGVYGNELARDNPDRAHAVLTVLPDDNYLVSVRAPMSNKTGADELCRQFETGGGRKAAAGINRLPQAELSRFISALDAQYA